MRSALKVRSSIRLRRVVLPGGSDAKVLRSRFLYCLRQWYLLRKLRWRIEYHCSAKLNNITSRKENITVAKQQYHFFIQQINDKAIIPQAFF